MKREVCTKVSFYYRYILIPITEMLNMLLLSHGGAQERSTHVFLMSKSLNLYTFLLLIIILDNSVSLSLEMIMLIS